MANHFCLLNVLCLIVDCNVFNLPNGLDMNYLNFITSNNVTQFIT